MSILRFPDISGLGRFETWARLGRIATAESMFNDASLHAEEQHWRRRIADAPHGNPWYSSLHVSQFPAEERHCPRQLAYGLMGFADETPFKRMVRGTMIVGQAAESWNVQNLYEDGRLLSAPDFAEHQTGFTDADHWLTGAPDFIVLPPGWNRPFLIETKTKDLDYVVELKKLNKTYDAKHARQIKGYIGLGHRITPQLWSEVVICKHTWRLATGGGGDLLWVCRDHGLGGVEDKFSEMGSGCLIKLKLEPLRSGALIYMGRDRPNVTQSYVFEHDEEWFQRGLAKLTEVQEHFRAGTIPSHPFGGKDWSKDPCRFCDYKKHICKPDHNDNITSLTESNGVDYSREIYGDYDPEQIHKTVIDRWAEKSGIYGTHPTNFSGRGVKSA